MTPKPPFLMILLSRSLSILIPSPSPAQFPAKHRGGGVCEGVMGIDWICITSFTGYRLQYRHCLSSSLLAVSLWTAIAEKSNIQTNKIWTTMPGVILRTKEELCMRHRSHDCATLMCPFGFSHTTIATYIIDCSSSPVYSPTSVNAFIIPPPLPAPCREDQEEPG